MRWTASAGPAPPPRGWHMRITRLAALVLALLLPSLASAQEDPPARPAADSARPDSPRARRVAPIVVGAGLGALAGVGTGLVIADATDYALEEGGLYMIMILGGGLGALVGGRVGASLDNDRSAPPGRLQVELSYGRSAAGAESDLRDMVSAAGLTAENRRHRLVGAVLLSVRLVKGLEVGVESSGLAQRFFQGYDGQVGMGASLRGGVRSILARYLARVGAARRRAIGAGAGLDRYDVTAESWFDPLTQEEYPSDQPSRASLVSAKPSGWHVRGDLSWYPVRDARLLLGVVQRHAGALELPGITLQHPDPTRTRTAPTQRVRLSSTVVRLGLALHYF